MTAFGDQLRRAREAKGATVDDVSGATRIARRYLLALERSDLDALPGSVFDKGYIKAYAQYLGVDPEPLLEAYTAEARKQGRDSPDSARQQLEELKRIVDARGERRPRRPRLPVTTVVVIAVAIATVAGISWLLLRDSPPERNDSSTEEPPSVVSRSLSVTETPESSPPAEPPPTATPVLEANESAPVAESATPSETRIAVTQSGVGTGVVDRNLVGESDRFVEGSRVWFWTRVVGGESGDRIRHVWIHGDRIYMNAALRVGGSHWRTYSTFVLPPGTSGAWTVEARASDGRVLSRAEFHCATPAEGT